MVGCRWALLGVVSMVLGVVWKCWVLLGGVGCCWVLLGINGCGWMFLGIVGRCWILLEVFFAGTIWYWLVLVVGVLEMN